VSQSCGSHNFDHYNSKVMMGIIFYIKVSDTILKSLQLYQNSKVVMRIIFYIPTSPQRFSAIFMGRCLDFCEETKNSVYLMK